MSSKCIRDTVNKVKSKYQETDPYRLAAAMHILVQKMPMGNSPTCCKGFCMTESRKTCIVINCDLPDIIQQIILIHEIGHAVLHQRTMQVKCFHDFELFDGVSQCEYEANCFAADYLLEDWWRLVVMFRWRSGKMDWGRQNVLNAIPNII